MLRPETLQRGDTVGIVSPAGAVCNHAIVEKTATLLREWGLNVKISSHCLGHQAYYSGSIDERRNDMLSMLSDKEVKAIICSYGGFGSVHIIDDFSTALAETPKWIIGMSDCCTLHAAALDAGIMSLHSPQCNHLSSFPQSYATRMLHDILFGATPLYHIQPHPMNITGKARGIIAGGNLSVICGLLRTRYDIFKPSRILFIEDINEPFHKVERMIQNLKLSGILQSSAALVVGEFVNITGCERFGESVYEMIRRITEDMSIPVCFNFPIGHGERNLPIIEGAEMELHVNAEDCTLKGIDNSDFTSRINRSL